MVEVASTLTGILEPYVGRMVADTCVRASALSIGKTSDVLSADDLPQIEQNIRRVLAPVASKAIVDDIIQQIERRVA
ncbi:MAG TPA: hypothetical protein VF902_02760 [Coriobacteriia bacterium]